MKTFTRVQAAEALKKGAVGIIPTDTVYGVVCSALHPQALERLYAIKKRHPNKAYIVLISALDDVAQFTTLSHNIQTLLTQVWPGPVSVVLPTKNTTLAYLHRGNASIAFRLPADPSLQALLKVSGPLAAPSANPNGLPPAKTVTEAYAYFKNDVDFYVDGGPLYNSPSTLIELDENDAVKVLREGAIKISLDTM